ncbi:MAG: penicillin-binding protein 2 [Candidatus Pacebacteria bacterium]|nr:penicillin-binding protein 2 [Candidatus Paceibacterota bacterium]
MKNWKISIVFFLFLTAGLAIVVRLADLQIRKGSLYEAMASGQNFTVNTPVIKRGSIFLENGEICLAQNKTRTFLYISSQKISPPDVERIAASLAPFLGLPESELTTEIQKAGLLKKEILDGQADNAREYIKQQKFTSIWTEEISGRFYPYNALASQLLGFVNNEGAGQYGLESYYNSYLAGQEADIFLTIDYNLQYFAEKALKQAKEQWNIDSGQIIVEEPSSGRIIALANFPGFDGNKYGEESDLGVFINSVTQKLFEPGSVFKPITMAAGLEERLVTPETKYTDEGSVDVGGKPIYNFNKRVWGEQTMIDVLEESINTGVVFVEQKLGSQTFWRYIQNFGFLEKTDIDLPGEVASANEGLKRGYPRDFAVASFGQGIMITPIQLIRAFGAIANKGRMMQPYVVEKIVQPNGQVALIRPKEVKQVISESTAAKLTAMLISVVKNGAGRAAQISGYYITGKTGTAQVPVRGGGYSDTETIQSFIGYFPALNPKYLVLIKLDNPKGIDSSGHSAAVVFHDVAKYIIDLKQIPPSPDAP